MSLVRIFMWIGVSSAIIVLVVFLLWLLWWWSQGKQFKRRDVQLTNKVVIITGCNTGIGKETAINLSKRGAKIYMACRDRKHAEEARREIIHASGHYNVFFIACDLASFASIRAFVKEFLLAESNLHILINNAGVMTHERIESKDGFEMQLATNHLGHFLLTNLLLDTLKASMPSRIVNVSTGLYEYGRINRNDLNSEKSFNYFQAYSQSRLANILFTRSLTKRLLATGVTANALYPGFINTGVTTYKGVKKFVSWPVRLCMRTAKSGAQTTNRVAVDPDLEQVSGQYFENCRVVPVKENALDDETAEWLWEASVILTRLNSVDETV